MANAENNRRQLLRMWWRMLLHPIRHARMLLRWEMPDNPLETATAENEHLRDQLAQCRQDLQLSVRQCGQLENELIRMTGVAESRRQEIETLQARTVTDSEMQRVMDSIETRLNEANRMKRAYELKITNLELRLDESLTRLRQSASRLQSLESQLASGQAADNATGSTADRTSARNTGRQGAATAADDSNWLRPLPDDI